mmetsp:Transcript_11952/g.32841  ORF Transcript_11952/g.32841 Transcript_11952/m.32841 type:complete len:287 (+) Transcript_11952:53-913(+)
MTREVRSARWMAPAPFRPCPGRSHRKMPTGRRHLHSRGAGRLQRSAQGGGKGLGREARTATRAVLRDAQGYRGVLRRGGTHEGVEGARAAPDPGGGGPAALLGLRAGLLAGLCHSSLRTGWRWLEAGGEVVEVLRGGAQVLWGERLQRVDDGKRPDGVDPRMHEGNVVLDHLQPQDVHHCVPHGLQQYLHVQCLGHGLATGACHCWGRPRRPWRTSLLLPPWHFCGRATKCQRRRLPPEGHERLRAQVRRPVAGEHTRRPGVGQHAHGHPQRSRHEASAAHAPQTL